MSHPSRTNRVAGVVLGALALASLTGCKQWGPLESSYNGSVRVRATGTAYLENSQRTVNSIRLEDPANDGNSVYARSSFYAYRADDPCYSTSPCVMKWHLLSTKSTPEISNRVGSYKHSHPLDAKGLKARIRAQACAQMGWPVPDSCSNEPAIATFDY